MQPEFVMHLIIPAVDGPIVTGDGPALPAGIPSAAFQGRTTFSSAGTFTIACGLPKEKFDGSIHRATDSHTDSVNCKFCKSTDIYKKLHDAIKAGITPRHVAVSEYVDGCC